MAIIKSHSHSLTLVICSFVSIAQIAQIRTTETTPYPIGLPHPYSLTMSLSLDVLNNFCFHVYVSLYMYWFCYSCTQCDDKSTAKTVY